MHAYKMAFVDAGGNDSTAIVGDINHPFSTLAAAITAVSALTNPIVQVMSDLTITSSIHITKSVNINLYNGIVLSYTNNIDSNSLFVIDYGVNLTISSNGCGKVICTSGTYLSSFATVGSGSTVSNSNLLLQNINIKHIINSVFTTIATIITNSQSLLSANNCHILTSTSNTGNNISCYNIKCDGDHIIELSDSKLTLLNSATGGRSIHIFEIDSPKKTSLINCQTIQILPNFVNPISDPLVASNWTKIEVMGTAINNTSLANYSVSNCKFYINSVLNNRLISTWTRYVVWPMTSYDVNHSVSIVNAIRLYKNDVIEYLGTSLHNYGRSFSEAEVGSPPIQYGGVYTTSLVRCPLLQPYEIL